MEKGLGEYLKQLPSWLWKTLAALFTSIFMSTAIISMSTYTVMEGIVSSFNLPPELAVFIGLIYAVIVIMICLGFIPRVARTSELLVPLIVAVYIGGSLGILLVYVDKLLNVFVQIFTYAFTPAAAGGFASATVLKTFQVVVARRVYSNEAGWGSAPHINSTVRVNHPVKQGVWGVIEVFVDTIIVYTITGLVVISTGIWQTGVGGIGAVLTAFRNVYGDTAPVFLHIVLVLFVLTTSTGWYSYYEVEARYWLENRPRLLKTALRFPQIGSPLMVWIIGALTLLYGIVPAVFWTLGDDSGFANIH